MPRNRRVGERPPLAARLIFTAALVAYAFALQFSTAGLGSIDGYFHIRYTALLRQAGWAAFPPDFPWLPLTVLSPDRYFDHHMLFHVLLLPFTTVDLILGAKIAAAIGASAAFLGAYFFLCWQRVRRAEWWMVALLAGAPGFLYRIEMPRVQAWSLVCLLIALALLLRRRDGWLFVLAWIYAWLYNAFPLLLAMCACAVFSGWLLDRVLRLQPILYATGGTVAGLVINPYVPHNLRFIAHHYGAKLNMTEAIPVGAEWYPLPIAEWFGWGGLLALLTGLAALLYQTRQRLDHARLTAILVAVLFLCLLWRASRFVEYFVPFAALALALSLHERVDDWLRRIQRRRRRAVALLLLGWLAVSTGLATSQLRGRPPATRHAQCARWIASHTEPGAMVFLSDWDDFPLLYFHDPGRRYVIGLDPSYLSERDPELYASWRRISAGEHERPAQSMRDDFGASVALSDRQHEAFLKAMDADPLARRSYEDGDCVVYAVDGRSDA